MRISQILDKIDENQLFVPIFQREYVWKREDAKKLIDSLIKEYPTGTMLTWETNTPPKIKGSYQYTAEKGAIKILLDGQQRVTTLYMLVRGKIPPYYTKEEVKQEIVSLCVNLETLDLEYYSEKKMIGNPLWVRLHDVFQKNIRVFPLIKELQKRGEIDDAFQEKIEDNLQKIQSILDREFLEQTIPVKATIKEAIDIFYVVNASGVNLTDAELALAQISGYWPEARDVFKVKLQELQKNGFNFKLDFLVYVLLGVLYFSGSDMSKLHGEENYKKILNAWDILSKRVLDYVCNVMKTYAFIDHTDEINSIYAFIPIIVFAFYKENHTFSPKEIRQIVKWFYYSQIRTRYVNQLPQKLDKDLSIVRDSDAVFDDLLSLIQDEKPLKIHPDEFIGAGVSHPLFGLMMWYFKSKGAVCLTTGLSLHRNMGEKYSLEKDHIFAYSILKNNGYDRTNRYKYRLAQELTNRAILTQIANRTKLDKDAIVYLSEIKQNNPDALRLQCIPEDENLWKIENYELFIKKRRQILADELNKFLEGLAEMEGRNLDLGIEEMIAEGESKYLEFKSSLRWDTKAGVKNEALEQVVLKVIASFSNAEGGTLLIGIDDEGTVLGLQNDYDLLSGTKDEFELHLTNQLNKSFGPTFKAMQVDISFPKILDKEICMIQVKPGEKPLYLTVLDKNGQKNEKFYVRSGNSSQEFASLGEITNYISKRFDI